MRLARVLIAVAALTMAAHRADARAPAAQPGTISVAWPAPAGHFQPRAGDIPIGIPLSPSHAQEDALDRALDEKLKICRGC
jgi:hypothetical protein